MRFEILSEFAFYKFMVLPLATTMVLDSNNNCYPIPSANIFKMKLKNLILLFWFSSHGPPEMAKKLYFLPFDSISIPMNPVIVNNRDWEKINS